MNTQLLEKSVAHAMQQPRPPRKYEIDQMTTDGLICGFYWVSISHGFGEFTYPGWWYVIYSNSQDQGHVFEADIKLVGEAA